MLNLTQIGVLTGILSIAVYFMVQKFKNILVAKPAWQEYFSKEVFGVHRLEIASILIGAITGIICKVFCVIGLVDVLVNWGLEGLGAFVNGSWALYMLAGLYAGFQTTSLYSFFKTTAQASTPK